MNAPEKFIICDCKTGLGNCFFSLVSCWNLAKKTNRTLIIAWHNSSYQKKGKNFFLEIFEPIKSNELLGVKCLVQKKPINYEKISGIKAFDKKEANSLKDDPTKLDKVKNYRVWKIGTMFRTVPTELYKKIFQELKFKKIILKKVDKFYKKNFKGYSVTGIHFRDGNGEGKKKNTYPYRIIEVSREGSEEEILKEIKRGLNRIKKKENNKIFLCTDSIEIENLIKNNFPNVITRKKKMLKPGEGPLHRLKRPSLKEARNALIEMILLSKCDNLIHRYSSFTDSYALKMTDFKINHLMWEKKRKKKNLILSISETAIK